MKPYELFRIVSEPFLPSHYYLIRKRLRHIARSNPQKIRILDVGGRESPYTVGVPAEIIISELPRQSDVQRELNLGINENIIDRVMKNRSNIVEILYDDMTHSKFDDNMFDCIVAVEVLEHVTEDSLFVSEVARVLKPGGFFLMTTPNGDWVPNTNPDHKRHYTRQQLESLLSEHLTQVDVKYGVRTGVLLHLGWTKRWSIKRPLRTSAGVMGNSLNLLWSLLPGTDQMAKGTAHLIAAGMKREG